MKPFWKKIITFWKDPVVAGTLATLLSTLILYIWNKLDESSFQRAKMIFIEFLTFKITLPVWALILATLTFRSIILFRRYILVRRATAPRNPILDEKIGSYTFEQLYEILANEKLRIRTEKMKALLIPPPDEPLLKQFIGKYEEFRQGVPVGDRSILIALGTISRDDGGYTAEVLMPKLLEYGLLEVEKKDEILGRTGQSFTVSTYYISETGYKFFDCLKKLTTEQSR